MTDRYYKKYDVEEQKAELEYLCSGDAERFCRKKRQIRQEACACLKSYADRSAVGKIKKPQYNRWLNYAGDQSLLNQIEGIEKAFVPVRKKVSKEEYIEQFQQLFRLRNEFAGSAGFTDYLAYQYALLGIDGELLDGILETTARCHTADAGKNTLREKIQKWKNAECLKQQNQIDLAKKVLEHFHLQVQWDAVQIHHEGLPQFFIGNCISISVPDESHVLINLVPGLSGFSILMHEIGHAYYYNHIRQDAPEWAGPYSAVIEEFVALVFEDLVYSPQFLSTFLGSDEDLLMDKLDYQTDYLCCCAWFEQNIYRKDMPDLDAEWEAACEKYAVSKEMEWRSPHFFVSYPGFFAVDVMAGHFVKLFYEHVRDGRLKMDDFLQKQICEPGRQLDFERVISQTLTNV